MARQSLDDATLILKEITHTLNSTPPDQLPRITPRLANSLLSCQPVLCLQTATSGRGGSEPQSQLHKFRTRLSSLLQDRSPERRWAGVVLIKTAIEIGRWEMLSACSSWVMGLRGVLSKADPATTKKLAVVTLTRIFLLTREYPSLQREITTPALPEFITRCQSLLQAASPSVQTRLTDSILSSFAELIPRHPATFRPHHNGIRGAVMAIISQPALNASWGRRNLAYRVLCLLPCCISKDAVGEWQKRLSNTIQIIHQTANHVFRAIIEEWEPSNQSGPFLNKGGQLDFACEIELAGLDTQGMPTWSGVTSGSEHLITLLELLTQFVTVSVPDGRPITLPIGSIVNLMTRLFSITVPNSQTSPESALRPNREVSQTERQSLWASLPRIHSAALELLSALVARVGRHLLPLVQLFLQHIGWLFEAEASSPAIRTAAYTLCSQMIELSGPDMQRVNIDPICPLLQSACSDLVGPKPLFSNGQSNGRGTHRSKQTMNADSLFNPSSSRDESPRSRSVGLTVAASTLLCVALERIDPHRGPKSLRVLLDRTAILLKEKKALVGSVLNPSGLSMIPMLAREFAGTCEVDGILRPRMPPILTTQQHSREAHPSHVSDDESTTSSEIDQTKIVDAFGHPSDRVAEETHAAEHPLDAQGETHILGSERRAHPVPQTSMSDSKPPPMSPKRKVSPGLGPAAAEPVQPVPKRKRLISPQATTVAAIPSDSIQEVRETKVSTTALESVHSERGETAETSISVTVDFDGERSKSETDDSDEDFQVPTLYMRDEDEDTDV